MCHHFMILQDGQRIKVTVLDPDLYNCLLWALVVAADHGRGVEW